MSAIEQLADENSVPEGQYFERIDGVEHYINKLEQRHQLVADRIFAQLEAQLSARNNMTIKSSFNVYPLHDRGDTDTVVQPDIFIACYKSKFRDDAYCGAPQLIVEILTSNRSYDMVRKLNLYERAGISEYWMVDPDFQVISVLELSDGKYVFHAYSGEDEVPLVSVPGCTVDFKIIMEG